MSLALFIWLLVIGSLALTGGLQVWFIWSVAGPPKFGLRAMLLAVTVFALALGMVSAIYHLRK
jgi:hypothetical protein